MSQNLLPFDESETSSALAAFDDSALAPATRQLLQNAESQISQITLQLQRVTNSAIWQIGTLLNEVKESLPHGQFEAWTKARFPQWGKTQLWRFMRVATNFEPQKLEAWNISPSGLYLLSEPSTPESARFDAVDRLDKGEHLPHKTLQTIIASHKNILDAPKPAHPLPELTMEVLTNQEKHLEFKRQQLEYIRKVRRDAEELEQTIQAEIEALSSHP